MGTFGVVRLVQDKKSQATFALKSMRKQKVYDMGQVEHIIAECKLLSECEHPFIVQLVRTYEVSRRYHAGADSTAAPRPPALPPHPN